MTRLHSSVWAMPPEVVSILRASLQNVPPSTNLQDPPQVLFGTYASAPAGEAVIVSSATRRVLSEPHTSGEVGGDELHELEIVITSNVPGHTAEQAWERLALLGQYGVEDAFRNRAINTGRGRPIITTAMTDAGVKLLWLRAPETQVVPMQGAGAGGWLALAQYVLVWQARI